MDSNDLQTLAVGRKVIFNGYPGTVTYIHAGQLLGMVNVRLESGLACVGITELTKNDDNAV